MQSSDMESKKLLELREALAYQWMMNKNYEKRMKMSSRKKMGSLEGLHLGLRKLGNQRRLMENEREMDKEKGERGKWGMDKDKVAFLGKVLWNYKKGLFGD